MRKLVLFFKLLTLCIPMHARIGCFKYGVDVDSPKLNLGQPNHQKCSCRCEPRHRRLPNGRCQECDHYLEAVRSILVKSNELSGNSRYVKPGVFTGYSFYGQEH